MDDLIAFLRARLGEDEAVVRAAQGDDLFNGTGIVVMHTHGGGSRSVTLPSHVAGFVARWDPARVLALISVLKQTIDDFHGEGREGWIIMALGEALYGDHPDYREEWRP